METAWINEKDPCRKGNAGRGRNVVRLLGCYSLSMNG